MTNIRAALASVCLGLGLLLGGCSAARSTAQPSTPTASAKAGAAAQQVIAEGKVLPARSAAVSPQANGVVAEVLVQEGAEVKANQALVRLDSAAQQTRMSQAQAQLRLAEANLQRLKEGSSPEALKVAEANLRQAEAALRQVRSSVSPEDIKAARAAQQQAQLQLERLKAGPQDADLRNAQAQLDQSKLALENQREQLSAAKTQSQLRLDQANESLVQAQSTYSTAYWNWRYVQDYNKDPLASPKAQTNLTDTQRQQFYDAYLRAEAQLRSAESAVQAAQVAFDAARDAEVKGLQQASQQVTALQAAQERVRTSITADQVAGAQAQIGSARAQITRLTGSNRADQLGQAEASVAVAQANLEQITAGPRPSEIAAAEAQVASAKADVEAAQVALDQTVVRAPFGGTVITLDTQVGEFVQAGTAVARLADSSNWELQTTDLTELDIANVRVGTPATMTFDALPGVSLKGKVQRIRSFGENRNGDVIYAVVIVPDTQEPRLRWNMTAAVSLDTQSQP